MKSSSKQIILSVDQNGQIKGCDINTFKAVTLIAGESFLDIFMETEKSIIKYNMDLIFSSKVPTSMSTILTSGEEVFVFMSCLDQTIQIFVVEVLVEFELLFNEIIKLNNEHVNEVRNLTKRLSLLSSSEALFEEIMRLNNELINTRRELSIKNNELKKLNSKLEEINFIDFLTGIYNRRKFFKDIYERVTTEDLLLVMLDFNNFKMINDTFGHKRGDEALQFFASELKDQIKHNNGVPYRLGGDEFAFLVSIDEKIDLNILFTAIDMKLKQFHELSSIAYGSVTVTKDNCNENHPAEESMKLADEEMYILKQKIKRNQG